MNQLLISMVSKNGTRLFSKNSMLQSKLHFSTSSSSNVTSPSKSAYELDDVPLFSLRTRAIIFTIVGGLGFTAAASYWLNLDRENAYWVQDVFPTFIRVIGPYLGLPVNDKTGELNRAILGPRDVRDLVGTRIDLEMKLKNGVTFVS